MQFLEIEPTYKSPYVLLDPTQGEIVIRGKSILVNVDEFYNPLLSWIDEFIANPPAQKISVTFDLEYYNLASTKRFLFILLKLKALKADNVKVEIKWVFLNQDKDAKELGIDLAQMSDLDFEFCGYEKLHSQERN